MACKEEKDCTRMPWCRFAGRCLGPKTAIPSMLDYGEGLSDEKKREYWDELVASFDPSLPTPNYD
jgi:hypothetical protein